VTTTFPVVAPEGTGTTIEVGVQVAGVAATPLNVTVFPEGPDPKLLPEIVTVVPIEPEDGETADMDGGGTIVKLRLLLTAPFCTTYAPEVPATVPDGTTATI
jgi:hypothetical protein